MESVDNKLDSDDSLSSSNEEEEVEFFKDEPQVQHKQEECVVKQAELIVDEPIQTNPETDMINFANYYKQFIRDPGIDGRKASRLLFLRSFNNWVKATLIGKYTYYLGKDLSVLDLCCGRGGDLEKYFRSQVKLYVGADLSEESLRNAMDRIIKIKSEKFKNNFRTKCFFITEDISDLNNQLLKKIPNEFYFDFVSCQFAMHYHFESEAKVRAFLENVSKKLNEGGYFVGTIIDANVLVKRLRSKHRNNLYAHEKFTFGNDFYSVKFYQKRFNKEQSPYGIKYGFYLEDSIDKRDEHGKIKYVGEYLVIFDIFVKLCKEYDLHLVERKNFTEFYKDNMENSYYKNLFRKMIKEIDSATKDKQWEIINLYQAFVFKKGSGDNRKYYPVARANKIEFKDFNPVFIEDTFE